MKFITTVIGFSLFTLSLLSNAKEVELKLPIKELKTIEFSATEGEFSISGWQESYVSINGQLDNDLTASNEESNLILVLNSENSSSNTDKLIIKIPNTNNLVVTSDSADFSFDGLNPQSKNTSSSEQNQVDAFNANVSIESVDGNIKVSNSIGNFNIRTVNGDIKILDSEGVANIQSVSGQQDVKADFRTIRSSNVSGKSAYVLKTIEKLNFSNVNGASLIESAVSAGASIQIQSVKGNVEFLVPEATSARFSLQTHQGGEIKNTLYKGSESKSDSSQVFTLEQASASISIDTMGGDIIVAPQQSNYKTTSSSGYDWSSVDTGVMNFAFINPNYNIFDHKEIFIKQPEIHFDSSWDKKYGKKVTKLYRDRIHSEYAEILKKAVADKFSKSGHFTILEQRKEGALVIIPKVIELYIDNPEIVGITDMMITTPAGNAKIDLVVFSPEDNSILALFMDKRGTHRPDAIGAFRPKAVNRKAFSKLFNSWAKDILTLLAQ